MKTLNNFPNLQSVLKKIALINQLVEVIFKNKKEDTLIGLTIIHSIEENCPANLIFDYIKDMAKDNRDMIDSIISCELAEEILNLK